MRLLPRSTFARNVLTLMTGTIIAQAIPLVTSPILTRLYTPHEFGVAAVYAAIAGILATVATTKYELAIMLPQDDADAEQLVFLSLIVAAVVSVVLFVIMSLANSAITRLLGSPEISDWLYLVPVTVLFAGANQSFNYWLNRRQHYREMSRIRVLQSGTTGAVGVGMGVAGMGVSGLILGGIVAHGLTVFLTGRTFLSQRGVLKLSKINELARRYANHPKFLLPSHVISATHEQFMVFFISALFASTAAGHFALAYKVAALPSALLANAVGEVFRQSAIEIYHKNGHFRDLFLNTAIRVLILSMIPNAILLFAAPSIFAFVFGENWRPAGEYAQILAIAFFFVNAVDKTAFVLSATKYIFTWNLLRLVANLMAAALSYLLSFRIQQFLYLFAATNVLFCLVDIAVGYRLSSGNLRESRQRSPPQ